MIRQEILINATVHETRAAILENGILQELYIERSNRQGILNNIYLGKVVRIMPGMEAAFIDIGQQRAAFLHIGNIEAAKQNKQAHITEFLHQGQTLPVQIIKEPISGKGARLSTHLSVSSRYLVMTPHSSNIAVSAKIDPEQKQQLMATLQLVIQKVQASAAHKSKIPAGFIVRTMAENATTPELEQDLKFTTKLWRVVEQRIKTETAPALVYEEPCLVNRILRDMANKNTLRICFDDEPSFLKMQQFATSYMPKALKLLSFYNTLQQGIFQQYHLEDEIQRALSKKVRLKSGGYLIFEQTEAMVVVDVNTGSFVGSRNLEETSYRINLEAAESIAHQLRLRSVGGIIVVDFIDMQDEEHKRQVLRVLQKCLERDRAKTTISSVSKLGLVEITRKRIGDSLKNQLCEPCNSCAGRGTLKSAETTCYEIFRELERLVMNYQPQRVRLLANQTVIDMLHDMQSNYNLSLESLSLVKVITQVENLYTQEQFDVVIVS